MAAAKTSAESAMGLFAPVSARGSIVNCEILCQRRGAGIGSVLPRAIAAKLMFETSEFGSKSREHPPVHPIGPFRRQCVEAWTPVIVAETAPEVLCP